MSSFYPLTIALEDKNTGTILASPYTDLNLRVSPFSSRSFTMVARDGTNYTFGTIGSPMVPGNYKLYDTDDDLEIYVIVGESDAVNLTDNQTKAGVLTLSNQPVFNAGVKTDSVSEKTSSAGITLNHTLKVDTIAEKTTNNGVDIDGIHFENDLATSNIPSLGTTDNTFTNTNTFDSGGVVIGGVTFYTGSATPEGAITADRGEAVYFRTGASAGIYVKTADDGAATGWTALT